MSEERRVWLALLDEAPSVADAVATLHDGSDAPAGYLAAWRRRSKPVRDARRVDPRVLDRDGRGGWLSLVWPSRDALVPFDDAAVQQARRAVLADPMPADIVSTLLRDDSSFAGSVVLRRGVGAPRRLVDDPFARVAAARLLRVGPGLFGVVPPPPGPVIERHGSSVPWPGGTF
jgi:hypothetical protein